MKCFSVEVCIYSIILCFSDCDDSTCAFLIVMLIIYALFYSTCDYFCVCKMLFFFLFFFHPGFFVILILMYVCTCTFFDCQADFDVNIVQRRELVNFYGV